MNRVGLLLLAALCWFGTGAGSRLCAQSDDPSEVFLKAYMTSQAGEKLEHDNQFEAALAKFRFAGSLLEQVKKSNPDWQPAIVEYRSKKIGDSILRVQGKISTKSDLAAAEPGPVSPPILPGNGGPASTAPTLPENSSPGESTVDIIRPPQTDQRPQVAKKSDKSAVPASDAQIEKTTKELRDRVQKLEAELVKSKKDYTAVQKEKENLSTRLQETNTKLQKAQTEIEKAQQAEKEVRGQLAAAQESLEKVKAGGTANAKSQEALKGEIAQLKKALASAEDGRKAAEKQRDESSAKLNNANAQVAIVTKERDTLLAQLRAGKEAQDHVDALIAENSSLQQKLADTEKQIRDISDNKPKQEQDVADVRRQVEQLRQQLEAKEKQNKEFEVTVAQLRSDLDQANAEVNKAKVTGSNAEETARLTKENDVLRNIVIRERQEEARREQAKKLMLAEFNKLQIKSETLNQQIALLAQPVSKLSPEELALLRQPVVTVSDNNPATFQASFSVAKDPAPKIANADAPKPEQPDTGLPSAPAAKLAENAGAAVQTQPKPAVPPEVADVARAAKQNFDDGKYKAAEKGYQQILGKAPNNLYAISNLGVVYFRTGRLKAAEVTLKKAVTLEPNDEFSHRTLGIVYYSESKFDDAVTELTKALAINPKSFVAHNYLGITASQKGWQEAAEKEMNEALQANPDYADAHYNLAVIYATATPPAKELAKVHYAKATSLGAEADPSLEKLLR